MAFPHPLPGTGGGDRDHHRRDLRQGLQLSEPSADAADSLAESSSICSEVARQGLGRYVFALELLPTAERARVESLAALVRGLLEFARQPGFGGERLAKILLWQDRLEETLEEGRVDEPIFAVFAIQDRIRAWNRPALEQLQKMTRSLALTQEEPDPKVLSRTLLALLLGEQPGRSSVEFLASVIRSEPIDEAAVSAEKELPVAWHRALRYARFASRGAEPGRFRRSLIRLRMMI